MNTIDNGRTEARSRATRRLRRMTIGTTLLGVAATGSFGWIAAATYDGATVSGAEAAIVSSASGNSAATTTSTQAATRATSTVAPTLSTTTGNAHASSGGS